MSNKEYKKQKLSKFISLILRHKPETIDITLDSSGYANVDELIQGICKSGRYIDYDMLKDIVESDDKNRYSYNSNNTKIRANQGHSIKQINLNLNKVIPPEHLYHGTAKENLDSILKNGINKRSRQYVHLSDNIELAKKVGARHGEPIILKIDTKNMSLDNYVFYLSENNIWLTEFIPNKYIIKGEF